MQQDEQTRLEAQQAFHDLLQLPPSEASVEVHLATRSDDRADYYFLPLKKPTERAADDGSQGARSAARRFAEVLDRGLEQMRRLQAEEAPPPCPHSAAVVPLEGQVEYVDLRSAGEGHLRRYLEPLLDGGPAPNFDGGDEAVVSALRFYTIHDRARGVRSFRIVSPKIELGRSRRFAIIGTGHGGAYDLAEDRIFLFDDAVDCLLWQDRWMFILHRTQFQQMFNYFNVLETAKRIVLDKLGSTDVIKGFDRLREDSSGIAMATKLAAMDGSPVLAEDGPPPDYWERVRFVIDAFGLKVRVVGDDGDERFVYDPDCRWQLMHLLSDDYHVSPQAPQPTRRGSRALHKAWEELKFDIVVQRSAADAAGAAPAGSAQAVDAVAGGPRKGPRRAPSRPAAASRSEEAKGRKQPA